MELKLTTWYKISTYTKKYFLLSCLLLLGKQFVFGFSAVSMFLCAVFFALAYLSHRFLYKKYQKHLDKIRQKLKRMDLMQYNRKTRRKIIRMWDKIRMYERNKQK